MHPRITKSRPQRNTSLQTKGNLINFKNQQLYMILGFLDLLKIKRRLHQIEPFSSNLMMMVKQLDKQMKLTKASLTIRSLPQELQVCSDRDDVWRRWGGQGGIDLFISPPNHRPHFQAQAARQGGFDSILKGSQPLVKVLLSNFNSNPELKLGDLKGCST